MDLSVSEGGEGGRLSKELLGVAGRKHTMLVNGVLDFNQLVAAMFRSMCTAGIPVAQQIDAMWAMGIGIGHGGRGTAMDGQELIDCPYCGATGWADAKGEWTGMDGRAEPGRWVGGGHGGFCPNMDLKPADWLRVDA